MMGRRYPSRYALLSVRTMEGEPETFCSKTLILVEDTLASTIATWPAPPLWSLLEDHTATSPLRGVEAADSF